MKLQKNGNSRDNVQQMCAFRKSQRCADDIAPTSKEEMKRLREEEHRSKTDPFLFELLMKPKYVVKGYV